VDVLDCGHPAHASEHRLCRHLAESEEDLTYYRVLRGDRLRGDLICRPCDERRQAGGRLDLVVSCEGCVGRRLDDAFDQLGWRGEPGIPERPEPLSVIGLGRLDVPPPASDAAIWPTATGWSTLSADGLLTVDRAGRTTTVRVELPPVTEPEGRFKPPRLALRTARDGGQAAIVVDYGSAGLLLDTATGQVLRRLDRGDYHAEQTPFPCAFAGSRAGTVLVAATAWNRLDAFDPATGALLTERGPTSDTGGDGRPPHYLDYFHGALLVSPDGRRILDDGWVWAPVGIPRSWSVERWLDTNVREVDDGESCRYLRQASYLWDTPMCWLDDRRVMLWGLGADDEAMLAGVVVYDVETEAPVSEFAGPAGRMFCDRRRLYAADGARLTVWDPYTGDRTAVIDDLDVLAHHPDLGEFVVRRDDRLERVRLAQR
jgi:hypothetical protein